MHGVSEGVKLCVAAEGETADDAVFQACEEFRRRDRVWEEGNPENDSPQSKCWKPEEHWRIAVQRDQAVETVRLLVPTGIAGLLSKHEVLLQLLRWKGLEDEKVALFSLELLDNYRSFHLKHRFNDLSQISSLSMPKDETNGSQGERNWKSDVQKFIKSGWLKSLHSHF